MPAIDIDRDSAAEAAHRELAKPIYEHPSPIDRLINWIFDQLDYLEFRAGELPGGWFTILVTTLIVIAAAVLLVRIARRAVRTRGGADFGLFESGELTAAEHRAGRRTRCVPRRLVLGDPPPTACRGPPARRAHDPHTGTGSYRQRAGSRCRARIALIGSGVPRRSGNLQRRELRR